MPASQLRSCLRGNPVPLLWAPFGFLGGCVSCEAGPTRPCRGVTSRVSAHQLQASVCSHLFAVVTGGCVVTVRLLYTCAFIPAGYGPRGAMAGSQLTAMDAWGTAELLPRWPQCLTVPAACAGSGVTTPLGTRVIVFLFTASPVGGRCCLAWF